MARKPWTKMTVEELAKATKAFEHGSGPRAVPPGPAEMAKHKKAMGKPRRGRPRLGEGAARVLFTIEPTLLRRLDAFAREHGMNRSNLIATSVESYMREAIPPRAGATAGPVPKRRSA